MATKPAAKPALKTKPAATTTATPKTAKPVVAKPATTVTAATPAVKAAPTAAAKRTAAADSTKKVTKAPAAPVTPAKVVPKPTAANDKAKTPKVKMERDSFTMPKDEYAQIAALKKRLESMGKAVKKSELLRAGLKLLSALDDTKLKTALAAVPTIKTGRPKK